MDLVFFLVGVLALAGFYAILSTVLNVTAGWGGMWDLGVAGLVAVGAYTFVVTTQTAYDVGLQLTPRWPIWLGIIAAGLAGALVAFLIGVPALRLRGEYFLITTLAFAEVIRQLALNLSGITRGPDGFSPLARPFEAAFVGRSYRVFLLVIVVIIVALMQWLTRRLAGSPYGRLLRAFRDNESVALSLGKHVTRHRVVTFTFAGLLIGAVSPIYVWHIRGIVPQLFAAELTFVVWTALVIGGIGSKIGPLLGAVTLIVLTEMLTFLQGSAQYATLLATTRPIILGLLLIVVMRFRPAGIVSERRSFYGRSRPPRDDDPAPSDADRQEAGVAP